MEKASDILAFTCTYGDREFLPATVPALRTTAGMWFDWFVCTGAASKEMEASTQVLLNQPDGLGIQAVLAWKENRGQHHAMNEALKLARKHGYKWLLRLDDDITPKTKNWLKSMLDHLEELKTLKEDHFYRFIASPKILGLKNQLKPLGVIKAGQKYQVEIMPLLGGACRLHPVSLLEEYQPPLYCPVGRGDPQALSGYMETQTGGFLIRFPGIRMEHNTKKIEAKDTLKQSILRKMGYYWPYLGEGS